jgi:hypothetical protein
MASPSDENCPAGSTQPHKEKTMKTKLAKLALIAVLSTAGATAAFAHDAARAEAKQVIELKDGATLYIFTDGKMAMEDRYGRATRMEQGAAMETRDGRKITMQGDEVARLNFSAHPGALWRLSSRLPSMCSGSLGGRFRLEVAGKQRTHFLPQFRVAGLGGHVHHVFGRTSRKRRGPGNGASRWSTEYPHRRLSRPAISETKRRSGAGCGRAGVPDL